MTATRPARRSPQFGSLDDAVRDAEGLLAKGYEQAGNWSLAQCCGHLANWMTYPIAGFPRMPTPVRAVFWVIRGLFGRRIKEQTLAKGLPAGKPTITESVPAPGGDDAAAVAGLREAAARFTAHPGEYLPSPLFGRLTRDEALRLQLRHCEHHLSFLIPKV
jgi:hypothetical protein